MKRIISIFTLIFSFNSFAQDNFLYAHEQDIKITPIHKTFYPYMKDVIQPLSITTKKTSLNGCPITLGTIARGPCDSGSEKHGEGHKVHAAFAIDPKKLPYINKNGNVEPIAESPCFNSLNNKACFLDPQYDDIRLKILNPKNIIFIPSKLIGKSINDLDMAERPNYLLVIKSQNHKYQIGQRPNLTDTQITRLLRKYNEKQIDKGIDSYLQERTMRHLKDGLTPPPTHLPEYRFMLYP